MKSIVVRHNTLINPEEVNAAGSMDVAKFEWRTVAMSTVEHMDVFEALEFAYFKTQHIDSAWFRDAFWEFTQESRSSMVGDWIIVDGEAYKVASIGFEKVNDIFAKVA
jgi:hypothetical protein